MSDTVEENAEGQTSTAIAKVGIGTGGKISAFVPTSLDETWRLATIIGKSGMAPKAYKSPEQIMVGIMAGLELGLSPFTALQSIAIIGNNPSVWGDGALALVESSGLLEWIDEEFDEQTKTATCTVKRRGKPKPTVRTFGFDDAKQANLLNKEGPWRGYPKRMCQMRARAFAIRDTFADVLKGIGIAEEVQDYTPNTTRSYSAQPALSASMLNAQASGNNAKIDTIEGEAVEMVDAEPAQHESTIPEWIGQESRFVDRLRSASDRLTIEAIEKDFHQVQSNLPANVAQRLQGEIDDKFADIAAAD